MKPPIPFPGAPNIPAGAVDLSQPVLRMPTFTAVDLVEEATLAPGVNRFFTAKEEAWGKLGSDLYAVGVTVLGTRAQGFGPVVGACVTLRLREGERAAFDGLCTDGAGNTVLAPMGTVLLEKGKGFRLEVEAPEYDPGIKVRVILHGARMERV